MLKSSVPTLYNMLVVRAQGTRYTVYFGYLATVMMEEIQENVC